MPQFALKKKAQGSHWQYTSLSYILLGGDHEGDVVVDVVGLQPPLHQPHNLGNLHEIKFLYREELLNRWIYRCINECMNE